MAITPIEGIRQVCRALMRHWSQTHEVSAFKKADLEAAAVALDAFLDVNAAAINNALPQPFRSAATTDQKATLLAAVVLRRWAVEFLRRLFGEVD